MSAILTPISASAYSFPELRNSRGPTTSFSKRLGFSGEFSCRKPVCSDIRRRNLCKMRGSRWGRASTTDDGVPAFEQEAFVNESLTFEDGGIEATINHMSKWLISAILIVFILWRHDALALWASMGSAINATLSVVLKHLLNHERPVSGLRSDPGMPSSHAQSIGYTITFLAVSLVEMFGVNAFTVTLSGVFAIIGSYFAWLRVSQRLHTVSQVVVGAVVGFTFGFLWFWSWNSFVLNLFTSFLWAKLVISLGAFVFVVSFVFHSYQSWLNDT
ncbi:lipid phosphate phosphatase epsilon 1, chloroplastic-like isoform X1 [Salvia hispanica]|uniref:lipid phosphate phosphatase epsilon 1, chloroplastic-like isoform X1 n=2 Tax=Salvia hispanica TaxID=49212 RepID=UPI0020094D4D|nr:lipid phosphate phosphatase epsilon 1, chloroplastic-like isoform X1 [Salvia hispanica]